MPSTNTIYTAGMGLLMATKNGWEIDWSLFEFPNHLHRWTIVYKFKCVYYCSMKNIWSIFSIVDFIVFYLFTGLKSIWKTKNMYKFYKYGNWNKYTDRKSKKNDIYTHKSQNQEMKHLSTHFCSKHLQMLCLPNIKIDHLMKLSLSKRSATASCWLHFEISNFVAFVQNYWMNVIGLTCQQVSLQGYWTCAWSSGNKISISIV